MKLSTATGMRSVDRLRTPVGSNMGAHSMAYSRAEITPEIAAVIKKARALGIKYAVIASYYVINQGGIADVMKGRICPNIAPASRLPADFPMA